ncbi:MAG TPA: helix-turn-helix domain-containing protein [Actinomycetales bacterium]|nr:helix-turn-helix domain-containing protein [Actinomycetales bacterium]
MDDEVLARVATAGAQDAGGLPVELLGGFLAMVSRAVVARRPLTSRQLAECRTLGDAAARRGVALRALLDLYSSSAWRLWRHLPVVTAPSEDPDGLVTAGEVMLRAVDDAIAALAEGYQLAQHDLVRAQESARRELVDDLLSGGADVQGTVTRARGFGLDLSGPHAVAVVRTEDAVQDGDPVVGAIERALRGRRGDAGALVSSKNDRLVVVFAAPDGSAVEQAAAAIGRGLGHRPGTAARPAWQIGVSRARPGADGVSVSYHEAGETVQVATALQLDDPVVHARDVLVLLLLLRDRAGLNDLVDTVLGGLSEARGGARSLVTTLVAYFAAGANTAQAARDLHLSVRAVSYRLARVRELTGYDPGDATDELSLRVAVAGAQLLGRG